jgi:DNA-binding transcriptional MerR regulator
MSTILAFTVPQVQRLTGLSARILRYWDQTDVYRPTFWDERPNRAYNRIYSFRDVVSLRTLATLRRKYGVRLDELRKTGQYLRSFTDDPWTQRFWVQDRRVFFHHPETGDLVDRRGQTSYVDVAVIKAEVEAESAAWTERDPADFGRLERHRHIQRNQWVIKGTRVPTSAVWNFHRAGYSPEGIIREYPRLTPEDVVAAIAHEDTTRAAKVA